MAIRDFVFSTETVELPQILIERLQRRVAEEKALFAEETEASNIRTKLTLSLIFLFGSQSLATLASWFNQIATFLDPTQSWNGTAPFFEEIRIQTGYRIEQYGSKAIVLRFIHPYYEEAFALTAEKDVVTLDIISSTVKFAARMKLRTSINAITQHWRKYPELTFRLLSDVVLVLKAHGSLMDLSLFGLQMLKLHLKSYDQRHISLIRNACNPEDAVNRVNKEVDLQAIGQGLRFCFNYFSKLSESGLINMDWRTALAKHINWTELIAKWESESTFSKALDSLEWALLIDNRYVKKFLNNLKKNDPRFLSLTISEQRRFVEITNSCAIGRELRTNINTTLGKKVVHHRGRVYSTDELDPVDKSRGIKIDQGALEVLRRRFNLLPVGIVDTIGEFDREEIVSIFDENGQYIGKGITVYSAEDIRKIKGQHSSHIGEILSYEYGIYVMLTRSIRLKN